MKKADSTKTLEEALIDLYLSVKIRKQDEIENLSPGEESEERENLKKLNPIKIMDYIKTSIDILIDLKVEERLEIGRNDKIEELDDEKVNEYEALLRKLESDIRQHIRMEHQLKLHSESLQVRVEELEKENSEVNIKLKSTNELSKPAGNKKPEKNDKRDSEVNLLKTEIQNLKTLLKSYEEQVLRYSDLEKKLRNQNVKYEKDIKTLEEKYKEKINFLMKKVSTYEEMLKINNTSYKTLKKDEEENNRYSELSNDLAKSQLSSRKSPILSTERKKVTDKVKDKIENYRKLIDKKINDICNTNITNKSLNKSHNVVSDLNDRSASNHSFLTKEKTIENISSVSNRKNESLIKNLDRATKKIIGNDNYKTHYRYSSMEDHYNEKKYQNKSPNKTNITKNIHAMKEMLLNSNQKSHSSNNTNKKKQNKNVKSSEQNTSNIILNQGANPCFNQITIYTTNNNSMIKPNEINLRHYVFNKVNKPKSMSKIGSSNIRSSSNNNH